MGGFENGIVVGAELRSKCGHNSTGAAGQVSNSGSEDSALVTYGGLVPTSRMRRMISIGSDSRGWRGLDWRQINGDWRERTSGRVDTTRPACRACPVSPCSMDGGWLSCLVRSPRLQLCDCPLQQMTVDNMLARPLHLGLWKRPKRADSTLRAGQSRC